MCDWNLFYPDLSFKHLVKYFLSIILFLIVNLNWSITLILWIIKVEHEVKNLVAKDEHGLVIVHKLSHLQVFSYWKDAFVYAVISHRSVSILFGA